ncbi:MAG TPA: ExbD/TolR family protein [Thermoanaerobaculia bacterium]|nr:ExbD/TolR family protein [Thermoanaerobaculia bacterium]
MAIRFGQDDDLDDMGEINVTPLVDVMLVLLIIFMITAPMLSQGLEVELPQAEGRSFELAASSPAKITIVANGAIYVDGDAVGSGEIEKTLGPMLRARKIKRALLEADQGVPYGRVIMVLDVMSRAGVEQLGMITQPRETADARSGR